MTTVFLDGVWFLTLSFFAVVAYSRDHSGTDVVGLWLVMIPPLLLMLALLVWLISAGRLDWTGVPRWLLGLGVPGVLAAASVSMYYLMDKTDEWWNPYAAAVSWVLLGGLLFAIHGGGGPAFGILPKLAGQIAISGSSVRQWQPDGS